LERERSHGRLRRSEQPKVRAVGFLGPGYAATTPPEFTAAFLEGIATAGFKEGRDVAIEYRWADTHLERVPALALGLVRLRTNVIFTISDVPTLIAKGAIATIPIVFITASDPVAMGLADSLNRPGANVTGVTLIASQLGPKRIELLRELLPKAGVVSFLVNPNNANAEPNVAEARMAARRQGLETVVVPASNEQELDMAFAKLGQSKPDALLVIPDPVFLNLREQFGDLEARYAIPTIHYSRENVAAGGLLELRIEPEGNVSSSRHLRRPHPWRRETGRFTHRAADQIRAGNQSQDREGAWRRRASFAASPC
jgi:ABC-type uncharacterized transport system substrate-binding protein